MLRFYAVFVAGVAYNLKLSFARIVFKQREPRVEEQIEAVHLYAEHAGEYVMAELVYGHEYHKCQY